MQEKMVIEVYGVMILLPLTIMEVWLLHSVGADAWPEDGVIHGGLDAERG